MLGAWYMEEESVGRMTGRIDWCLYRHCRRHLDVYDDAYAGGEPFGTCDAKPSLMCNAVLLACMTIIA